MPLIEIDNATVWRGSTRVFDHFSLTVKRGEAVAVLGPNGSGKTTLLKLINRELYPVANGRSPVRILGDERWDVWDLRAHIGLISADLQAGFTPRSAVYDAIASGFFSSIGIDARLRDRIEVAQHERVEFVLQAVGLAALRDRAFGTLSTGQQRRCLLGRALVHDPHTLILDEPTSGLDMTAGFDFLARVGELIRCGRSILLVTHLLSEIPPEIERVVVLKNGKVAADGPKASVLTAALLSDVYETNLLMTEIDGHYFAWPAARTFRRP